MRSALVVLALSLAAAPAAQADVRLASGDVQVRALASHGQTAYAVVDSTSRNRPFKVVSSGGSSASSLGSFGDRRAGEPTIAAEAAGVLIGWSEPVSGGLAVLGHDVHGRGPFELAVGTGTPVLALREDGAAVAAYPDRTGDTAVSIIPGVFQSPRELGPYDLPDRRRLTADAPERRHRPLAVALSGGKPLVLDLVQTRTRTSLLVAGAQAPKGVLQSVGGLRVLHGTLAADGDTIAAAYAAGGRVRLATASPGGTWRTRTLPGSGARAQGAPAVALDGGEPVVVWTSRPRGLRGRELFAWSGGRTRRVTRSAGDDGQPLVAPREGAGIFVAWTRHDRGRGVPLLRRLG
jgi:hypothetical protein